MNPTTHISTAAAAAADPSIFGFLFWAETAGDPIAPELLYDALDAYGFSPSWRVPPVAALAIFTREAKKAARLVDEDENGARYLVFAPLAKTKTSSSFVAYLSRRGDKVTAKAEAIGVVSCEFAGVTGDVSWSYADFDRSEREADASYSDRRIKAAALSPREAELVPAFDAFAQLAASIRGEVADRGGKIDAPGLTELFRRAMTRDELCASPTRRAGAPYFVPTIPSMGEANPIKVIARLAAAVESLGGDNNCAVIPLHRAASNVDAVARPAVSNLEARAGDLVAELRGFASKPRGDVLNVRAAALEDLLSRAAVYRDLLSARLDKFEEAVAEARGEIARLLADAAEEVAAEDAAAAQAVAVASLDGLDDLDL